MTKEEKVSRRGYVKYAAAGVVVVAGAAAGAYYMTRPEPAPPGVSIISMKHPDPTPIGLGPYGAELLENWEKETGIKVNAEIVTWDEMINRISTTFAGGLETFDMCYTGSSLNAQWSQFLRDLTTLVPSYLKDDMPKYVFETDSFGGKLLGIHYCFSCRILFYNKKMFEDVGLDPEKPPTSWEEMIDYGKQITDESKGRYAYISNWGAHEGLVDFQKTLNQTGGEMFDKDGYPAMNSEAGYRALNYMVTLLKEKVADPACPVTRGVEEPAKIIGAEKAAMGTNWPVGWNVLNDPERSNIVGNVGVSIEPGDSTQGIRSGTIDGHDSLGITNTAKNVDACMKYIELALSPEVQKEMAKETSWMPIRLSVMDDPELNAQFPVLGVMKEQASYPLTRRSLPELAAFRDRAKPLIFQAFNFEISVEDCLKKMEEGALEVIEESGRGKK